MGERACKGVFCEGQCTVAVRSGAPAPDFYWDGQCTACPAKFYKDSHCLVVSRTSWIFNPTKAEHGASLKIGWQKGQDKPQLQLDFRCSRLIPGHCSEGGEIVDEKACGALGVHCEAKCRKPQSSPAPTPQLYWDGQCKACPAKLYSHCSQGGTLVGEKGCGPEKIMCEGRQGVHDWQYKWIKLGLERPHTVFIFCRTFHAPRNFASIPKNPRSLRLNLRSRVGQCAKPAAAPEAADWIIIGGGASGCAAAAALADAGEDVLVLERGQSDLDGGGVEWVGDTIYSPMYISMCEMRGEWASELCQVQWGRHQLSVGVWLFPIAGSWSNRDNQVISWTAGFVDWNMRDTSISQVRCFSLGIVVPWQEHGFTSHLWYHFLYYLWSNMVSWKRTIHEVDEIPWPWWFLMIRGFFHQLSASPLIFCRLNEQFYSFIGLTSGS